MELLYRWWFWIIIILVIFIVIWIYNKVTGTSVENNTKINNTKIDNNKDNSKGANTKINNTKIDNTKIDNNKGDVIIEIDNNIPLYTTDITKLEYVGNDAPIITSLSSYDVSNIYNIGDTVVDMSQITLMDSSFDKKMVVEYDNMTSTKKKYKQSKGEAECLRVLEKLRGKKAQVQVRSLKELRNDLTGRNFELDIFIPNDVNIGKYRHLAIEYHGKFHYVYTKRFHKNGIESFYYQKWKDNKKVELCDKAGIYLITVPYNVPLNKIEEFITYYLPENVYARANATQHYIQPAKVYV